MLEKRERFVEQDEDDGERRRNGGEGGEEQHGLDETLAPMAQRAVSKARTGWDHSQR
jgi:hypothetical protein